MDIHGTLEDDKKLRNFYDRAIVELNKFFEINWKSNLPKVVLVPDRKTYNVLRNRETESWEIGWGKPGENTIYLLSPENFEAESSHTYSDEKYFMLLKHELAHRFSSLISNNANKPVWLLEGVSIFVAGQNKQYKIPKEFTHFLEFHDQGGAGVYAEAGFVVQHLVEKFGKEKLLNLLRQTGQNQSKEKFTALFKRTYELDLSYNDINRKLI